MAHRFGFYHLSLGGLLAALCGLCVLAGSMPTYAQERGIFDISLGAVRVGVFAYSGIEASGRYSLAGQLRTVGPIGVVTNARYDAKTQGRLTVNGLVPEAYSEQATIGSRTTDLEIMYRNGVPVPPVFNPPRDAELPDADYRDQGDALDLLSALYGLFRDSSTGDLCGYRTFIYDGVRRTSIALRPLRRTETEAVCAGGYRRIDGFSEADMRRREVFDFQIFYAPQGGGTWRATKVDVESVYGVVTLTRRSDP